MLPEDFVPAGTELEKAFAPRPCVVPAPHSLITKVRIPSHASILQDLLLDRHRPVEQLRVPIRQPDPLGLALVEAEIAA